MTDPGWGGRLLVVGTGLIGTSVALAVTAAGGEVLLTDTDPRRLSTAVAAGAGQALDPDRRIDVDVVLVAVPPSRVGELASHHLRSMPGTIVSHVSSVQALPQ
jgi:prephenate dehydrogenase